MNNPSSIPRDTIIPIRECMRANLEIVDGDCPLSKAITRMREKRIGSLLVRRADGAFGIFTERDLLNKMTLDDNAPLPTSIAISDMMVTDLQTVDINEPYEKVFELMRKHNIRHMPITEKKTIIGMVSLRDLIDYHEQRLKGLNEKLFDKTVKLNAIIKLTEQLVSNMEPSEFLSHIVHIGRQLLHADTASVILFREDNGLFAVAASEYLGAPIEEEELQPSLNENNSITGWVVKNRIPVLLHGKTTDDPRFKDIPCNTNISCSICVPLVYKDSIKGTLNLNILNSDYSFTHEDLQTASTLANHIAVGLENNSMYRDLQTMYLRSLRSANERMQKMNEELRIAHEKIDKEIKTVAVVQQGLLPSALPQNKKVDIAAIYSASTTVGGDYYDCIEMKDGRLAFVIADVTGHGLPAAFIMTMLKILLFYLNQQNLSIEETMVTINDMFSSHVPISSFPSMIYGIFDPRDQTLTYLNAGHEPIVWINAKEKKKEFLYAQVPLLGVEKETAFKTDTVTIKEGDRLLFYTDGIPEAMDADKQFFSRERFVKLAIQHAAKKPRDIIDALMSDVHAFCKGVPFNDDVTLMVLGF